MLVSFPRSILLTSIFLLLAAPGLQGAEDSELEFRDKVAWSLNRPPTTAWPENEKAIIRNAFKKAQEIAPGVIARVTAYRPVRMYRARQQKGYVLGHADTELNAMYMYDILFEERNQDSIPFTIIHECVHLIEGAVGRENAEWARLVDDASAKVRQRVTESGSKYFLTDTFSTARTVTGDDLLQLPKEYGLPTLYACTNLAECVAESVEELSKETYDAPEEIKAFIEKNYLSYPHESVESLRRFHNAMELYTTAKPNEIPKFDQAIKILTELIEARPEAPHLWDLRGRVSSRKKDYKSALADFQQAATRYKYSKSQIYNLQLNIGNLQFQFKKYDKAIAAYGVAIEIQPRTSYAFSARAYTYMFLKDYDRAIADFSQAIARAPDADAYYLSRAFARQKILKYKGAIADLDVVLNKYKGAYRLSESKPLVERAECKVAIGDYAGADDDLTTASSLWKYPLFEAIYRRADVRIKAKRYDKAVEDLDLIIRILPKQPENYIKRGVVLWTAGKFDEADESFEKLFALPPNKAAGYYYRGMFCREVKEHAKAIADFTKSFELEPRNIAAIYQRGLARADNKEDEKAIADFSAVIKKSPQSHMVFFQRSLAYDRQQKYDEELADLDEALKLNPKYVEAYYRRAVLRATCSNAEVRDGAKAVVDAKKLIELEGNKKETHLQVMAVAYAEAGNFAEAVRWQEKAIKLAPDDKKDNYRANLELYKAGKPYRRPAKQ